MKKSIILFFALSALAQPAGAKEETVLYCVDELSTGFDRPEKGQWKVIDFALERFPIKVKGDWESLITDDWEYKCHNFNFLNRGERVICKSVSDWDGDTFQVDPQSLRYVRSRLSPGGFVNGNVKSDNDNISAGKCEKF